MASQVRKSANFIMESAETVKVNNEQLYELASDLSNRSAVATPWSEIPCHYRGQNILDYLFALDALNFCFWPCDSFEYENLSTNLKYMMEEDPNSLSPESLVKMSTETVQSQIFSGKQLEIHERTRLLNEQGEKMLEFFSGDYQNLLLSCGNSAEKAVELVATYFPGFRDSSIYNGRQVFFYKRAQIVVGDIWVSGAHQFTDIQKLTIFPDYRIPQLLHTLGVLTYSTALENRVMSRENLPAGSVEENEIRAATVIACELIAEKLEVAPIDIDHLLWQKGEAEKDTLNPHHRTYTIFY